MNTKFETNTLANGFTVKCLKNEYLHSVNIGIYIKIIPEPICGIAHMTEHMFFRRLANLSQQQVYYETDRIGATFKAATYDDFICFDITAAPTKFKEAFNLISKVFCDFKWSAKDVEAEKKVVRRQIEERYNSLYSKTDMEYYKGTPKGTPIMGNISDLNRMSAKSINAYRENTFVPANCCIVLTGNFCDDDFSYCIDCLKNISGTHNAENVIAQYDVKSFTERNSSSDKIYNCTDGFSDVCISFDVDENKVNRYAAEILHSILGFGVTSKLSQTLRERLGFISEIGGNIEFSEYAGRMTFEFEVSNSNLKESLQEAFKIISRSKGNLMQEDMESSIVFYTENQYRLLDDVRELNFLIGWRGFVENENLCSLDNLISRYGVLTIDDINQAATQIFKPENLVISISNDNRKLKKSELIDTFKHCRNELCN